MKKLIFVRLETDRNKPKISITISMHINDPCLLKIHDVKQLNSLNYEKLFESEQKYSTVSFEKYPEYGSDIGTICTNNAIRLPATIKIVRFEIGKCDTSVFPKTTTAITHDIFLPLTVKTLFVISASDFIIRIHNNITHLVIGRCYNKPFILSNKLKHFVLESSEYCKQYLRIPLSKNIIFMRIERDCNIWTEYPKNLKMLIVSNYIFQFVTLCLPKKLSLLAIGFYGNHMNNGYIILPSKLKYLSINLHYNMHFILPKRLIFANLLSVDGSKQFDNIIIPELLIRCSLPCYENDCNADNIPNSIRHIDFYVFNVSEKTNTNKKIHCSSNISNNITNIRLVSNNYNIKIENIELSPICFVKNIYVDVQHFLFGKSDTLVYGEKMDDDCSIFAYWNGKISKYCNT